MGVFDVFEPDPPIPCPRCGEHLSDWQGGGVNRFVIWTQGRVAPEGEFGDKRYIPEDELASLRLPERFQLGAHCRNCGRNWEGKGSCVNGIWLELELGDLSEREPVEARAIDGSWRQCTNCSDAWQFVPEGRFAECPSCGVLTRLATG
jgi:hypothetical protein